MLSPTGARASTASTSPICSAAATSEDGKVKNETVGNISHRPEHVVELVRRALAGERLIGADDGFEIERALPAGHVQAALVAARRLDLAWTIERETSRQRSLVIAMLISRVLAPALRSCPTAYGASGARALQLAERTQSSTGRRRSGGSGMADRV